MVKVGIIYLRTIFVVIYSIDNIKCRAWIIGIKEAETTCDA